MKLTLEKDIKVAVEVNGEKFIGSETGSLYQSITDTEILLYIKSETDGKEIKIKIAKDVNNQGA